MNVLTFILIFIAILLTIMCVTGLLYIITKGALFKPFYHDVLEWHLPDLNKTENICKFCGRKILQDSQGNWFSYDE